MKKNIILFITLVLLIAFVYQFEEKRTTDKKNQEEEKALLFDPQKLGEISSIEFINTKLVGYNGKFYTTKRHHSVDTNKLQYIFNILSGIRIKRMLDKEEILKVGIDNFFPDEKLKLKFIFQYDEVEFFLGKKLEYNRSFYMKVKNKDRTSYIIAHDIVPILGTHLKEDYHRSTDNYLRIKSILYLDESFFYNTYLFPKKRQMKKEKAPNLFFWKKIAINNIRHKNMQIDFKNKSTHPAIISGPSYNLKAFNQYHNELLNLDAEELIFDYDKLQLQNKLAQIKLMGPSNHQIKLELYRKYKNKSGFFVKRKNDEPLYRFKQSVTKVFYKKLQDFWNKSIIDKDIEKGLHGKNFELIFKKGQKYRLAFQLAQGFNVKIIKSPNTSSKDKSRRVTIMPNQMAFKKLYQHFKRQADIIMPYAGEGLRLKQNSSYFKLFWDNSLFHVYFKNGELVFINDTEKYKLHYWVGNNCPIGLKKEDFFL